MDHKQRESKNFDKFIKSLNKHMSNDLKIKSSLSYKEGVKAFKNGAKCENQYEKGSIERHYWFYGWYDEYLRGNLEKVFEKHGIEY